ncbi:hypothetical protein CJU73_08105 [Pseudomonas fragi]|nr:hypothetical protein BFC21_00600 [Pseudomonas sp. TMW 2.1634]PAA29854.1 hypothetical protein CJU73_08105 [Pseudomonas fragi]
MVRPYGSKAAHLTCNWAGAAAAYNFDMYCWSARPCKVTRIHLARVAMSLRVAWGSSSEQGAWQARLIIRCK